MSKSKKLSIGNIDEVIKQLEKEKAVEWHGYELVITNTATAADAQAFVNYVAAASFDTETGEYLPGITDFAIRMATIAAYANVNMPSNVEHAYDICYKTDLLEVIKSNINREQYDVIVDAAMRKIRARLDIDTQAVYKQVSEATGAVENIARQVSGVFDGVSAEDLNGVIKAMSENRLDEDKLVEAYFKNKEEK